MVATWAADFVRQRCLAKPGYHPKLKTRTGGNNEFCVQNLESSLLTEKGPWVMLYFVIRGITLNVTRGHL